MISVLFFASIRERAGTGMVQVEADDIRNVADVISRLRGRSPTLDAALSGENILVAVNQTMTDPSAGVGDGDEVALFPPVTGG